MTSSDHRLAVLGVDVGTTAVKVGLYDDAGTEHLVASRDHALSSPRPGWAEQDPAEVVAATLDAVLEVARGADERGITVDGLSVSTAMHSLIGMDADGTPVTPALTYADSRAADDADRLRADHLAVYRRTGTPLHPMSPLAKLCWFARTGAGTDVARWGGLKDHLLRHLTGSLVVDAANASATGLYDPRAGRWDDEALDLAGIAADQLSEVVDPTHVVDGGLTPEAAAATGLPTGTPVVAGATDGALANLGVGAITPGVGAVSIGTSGAVRLTVDDLVTDVDMRTFCYRLAADRYVAGGAINNGGLWIRWLRESVLGENLTPEDLSSAAATVAPGSDGVLVLPYLTGERAPQWSPDPAGVVFGLRLRHGRAELVRAGMEGVAHQLRLVVDALADVAGPIDRVRATGGFTNSPTWLQVVADVLGVPVELPDVAEAVAFGAAGLGLVALGGLDDLEAVADLASVAAEVSPDPGRVETYAADHARYAELVTHLDQPFASLAARPDPPGPGPTSGPGG